jgi:site-specific DNA recombinase
MVSMPTKAQAAVPTKPLVRKVRCAVYTRKSSEEGPDQEFNSLDAQREACEAYVASQRAEGWLLLQDRYDDGGVSGGTLERPALKRLIAHIEAGTVDVVVVYKIDRLSRSLMDFAKLVEVFDAQNVTFVSVTQSFNTTTSMGRLTLNILLSFAQFEREVIGERIRDKFAASRARGMWMGGWAPHGYDVKDRKLVVNESEAKTVRMIFERFARVGSATLVAKALAEEGLRTKRGTLFDKGSLYKLIGNRVYLGQAVHKGVAHPGEHDAIVSQALWDRVHAAMTESPRKRAAKARAQTPALLKGLLFGPTGAAMSPTHTCKGGRLYRYYVSQSVLKQGRGACPIARVPAGEIEAAVVDQLRILLRTPEIIVATWRAAKEKAGDLTEGQVRDALYQLDPLWNELFPAEQARIVQLLVERIDVREQGISIRLRTEGLARVAEEFSGSETGEINARRAA